jgi:WD40 repeat protein/tRNA A-37 threonylcarbamoyl transferase component Bud32
MPTSSGSNDYDRFDELAEEFAQRYRRGERPSLEEYIGRYPDLADEIREIFPALVEVEKVQSYAREDGHRHQPAAPPFREVGDYRIVREVGRGGMGVVYEAEQISLGRRVALKVLPRQASSDRSVRERFRREARAAAKLHHTNIVPVYEVGQDGEVRFYAMQFIQGQGLDLVIAELRRLRDRAGSQPGVAAASLDQSLGPRSEHSNGGGAGPGKNDPFALSPVLKSILGGRFDPGGGGPEQAAASSSVVAKARGAGHTTQIATGVVSNPTGSDPALKPTEFAAGTAGDWNGPDLAHPPPPGLSSSAFSSSGSAILPGGTQLSSVESGHYSFFRSVAQIGRQVAGGLAYAHARGVVHRDIKPSNLLLDTEGVVWITDFGLAKQDDEGLTQTGDILGTVRYMAPERFRGEGDARVDVYGLGLTLYELLALRPAFDLRDRPEMIEQIKTEEPKRPRSLDARIPRDLETIVLKAIEKDPKARYPTAEAMGEDLGRFLANEPIRARQVGAAEHFWRWARRNPGIAALAGTLFGVLVIATVCSLLAMQRFRTQAAENLTLANERETQRQAAVLARANEAAARSNVDQANASLLATQEQLRRTVHATRSNLALAAWENNDVGRLRSLLDLLRPTPGEPDLRGWEWRYLWQLGHEDRLALGGEHDFTDAVFSPDGQTLAGLEANGLIHFWDRRTGQSRRTIGVETREILYYLSPGSGVHALAFSSDGRRIAGPGPDASLVLYSVDTGLPVFRFEGGQRAVLDLAWSPDGQTLVGGFSSHVMGVWDARDGHMIHNSFGRHDGPVAAVAFSPDGRTIASASYDRTVKLWKPEDHLQPVAILRGHTDEVRAVAYSPDGERIASAGLDRSLRIWDARSGAELAVIRGRTGPMTALAYGPDNATVVTGSADETVSIWDTAARQEIRTFKGHTDEVRAVAYSPEGKDVASAGTDFTVRVWDTASRPRPRTLQSPSLLPYGGNVDCLAFSPDGRRLISGHEDHALRLWELPSGRTLHVIQGHSEPIKCAAFSPDGRTIASGDAAGAVRLWDAADGRHQRTLSGHAGETGGLVFTPDGQTIFAGGDDRIVRAWNTATGALRYVLQGHSGEVHNLALSPDGTTLASASFDKTCILWDLPARKPRVTLLGHTGRLNSVVFSTDGHTVATASYDHTVRLWDAADGSPRGILEGHIDRVDGLAFSPDGRLASSAWDKTIRLWDPASKQTLLVLKGHAGRIRNIAFSPDGRTLASASYDRTVKLWEAARESVLSESAPDSKTEAASAVLRSAR